MAETFKQPQIDLDPDLRGKIIGALSRGFVPDTDDFYKAIGRDASFYGIKPTSEWGFFDDLAHRPLFGGFSRKEQNAMQEQKAISEYVKGLPPAMLAPQPAMPQTTQQAFGTMPGPASAVPSLQPTPIEVGQQPGFDYGKEQFKNLMGLGDSLSQALPPTWQTPVEFNPAMAPNRPLQPVEQAQLGMLNKAMLDPTVLAKQLSIDAESAKKPDLMNVPAGSTVFDPNTKKPVFTAEQKTKKNDVEEYMDELRTGNIDPMSPDGKRLVRSFIEKKGTPQQGTTINLGAEVPPMITESYNAAEGALTTHDAVQRANQAISQGLVTLGPTATIRNKINQVSQIMGVGGKTTDEQLVNTRNVMRSLAQFSLAARKQLKGQGQVSDFEGKLIVKAESGEIDDMTMPELKGFLTVTDRLAKRQYDNYQRKFKAIKQNERMKPLAPFYELPDWTDTPTAAAAQQTTGGWSIRPVK